jgi:hypothetical protein
MDGQTTHTRRRFIKTLGAGSLAWAAGRAHGQPAAPAKAAERRAFFETRGVVILPGDATTWPWPERARQAGLTTIALHSSPARSAAFVQSDAGQAFLSACRENGIAVEYEAHALADLLPRVLFDKAPGMFRMDDAGERVRKSNLCVSSPEALDLVIENVRKYAAINRPDTHRHFFWIDDGEPMCRCPKCRELSDTDQAVLLENRMLKTLREADAKATLAHLAYANTLAPPARVKPDSGLFLEFAPIQRSHAKPLRDTSVPGHAEALAVLDANLEVFSAAQAQALEYWLDVSRFSGWKRENLCPIPWHPEVLRDDLDLYASRGIRHVTTFAVWADGEYAARFGDPPVAPYGAALCEYSPRRMSLESLDKT